MPSLIERDLPVRGAGSEPLAVGGGLASSTTPVLEIRVLAPFEFEVRLAGTCIAVRGSKRDALLAVLGLARGRVMVWRS